MSLIHPPSPRIGTLLIVLTALAVVAAVPVWFADDAQRAVLGATLWLAVVVVAVSLPLGTFLAVFLARTDIPLARLSTVLFAATLFLPLYLQAGAWQAGFGTLGAFSTGEPDAWLSGFRGAAWVHALAAIPWVTLIVAQGLRGVSPELEEWASLTLPPWRVLVVVTLRQAAPSIVAAALWIVVWTTAEMTVADLFMVDTFARHVYTLANLGAAPREALVANSSLLAIVAWMTAAAVIACHAIAGRPAPPSSRRLSMFRLEKWRWPAACFATIIALTVFGVPLANLLYKAGIVVSPSEDGLVRRWEFSKVVATLSDGATTNLQPLGWTALIGSLAAVAAVCAAVPLAWWARRGSWRSIPAIGVAATLAAVPGPLLAIGIIAALNQRQSPILTSLYDRSILAPWLAQTLRTLPLAILILWYAFRRVPVELEEAAAVDGWGPVARVVRVVLPSQWAALGVALLASFVFATGELSATVLVLPPGVTTVPFRVFSLLHSTAGDEVAGIVLVSLATYTALALVALCQFALCPQSEGLQSSGLNSASER